MCQKVRLGVCVRLYEKMPRAVGYGRRCTSAPSLLPWNAGDVSRDTCKSPSHTGERDTTRPRSKCRRAKIINPSRQWRTTACYTHIPGTERVELHSKRHRAESVNPSRPCMGSTEPIYSPWISALRVQCLTLQLTLWWRVVMNSRLVKMVVIDWRGRWSTEGGDFI